jgi:two-component sensor histidine kinase
LPGAKLRLTIKDDGVGLGREFPIPAGASLGLDLVGIFAKQLDAQLVVDASAGTSFVLTFGEVAA